MMNEIGSPGLSVWNGRIEEEYLSSLHGPAGMEKLAEMLRQEPACFTANWLVELTARQSKWTVVPASESPEDREAAEFLEQCMEDMSHSWDLAVINALSAQWFGFALLEIVWKRRLGRTPGKGRPPSAFDDGRIGIRKLAVRRQETIDQWELDRNGGVQGVVQLDDFFDPVAIPIDKLLHFIVIQDRGNPEGLALGEVAYKSWHMLQNFEIIDGIGAERAHVGLPVFRYLQNPTDEIKADVTSLGKGLVVNEKAYVTLPGPMVEFELLSVPNVNADTLRARINQLRWELTGLVMGNYIRLGTTDTGNRALSETLIDAFTRGIDALLKDIASVFNYHLVPRLFQYNPEFDLEAYPKLQPSKVSRLPLFVLQYLEGIASWLAAVDDEDNLWLRELLGMPYLPLKPETPEPPQPPQEERLQPEPDQEEQERMAEAMQRFVQAGQLVRDMTQGNGKAEWLYAQ